VFSKKIIFTFVFINFFLFSKVCYSQNRSSLAISVAAFDVIQQHESSIEGRLEFRVDKLSWKLNPLMGIMGDSNGAKHFYFGVFSEYIFGESFILSPSFAPGFYFKGKSKDLSFILEFRSQIEIAYRFNNDMKIGVSVNHISNASIKSPNIGVESLAFTFVFPFH